MIVAHSIYTLFLDEDQRIQKYLGSVDNAEEVEKKKREKKKKEKSHAGTTLSFQGSVSTG